MKNALIISYYFPPCEAIASWRPYSWSKYFAKNNIFPTIVTRNWNGTEKNIADYTSDNFDNVKTEASENSKIIYLPFKNRSKKLNNKIIKKLYYLGLVSGGYYEAEFDTYFNFKLYLENYLKNNKIDILIASAPPINSIRLVYELSKKFNIPYIVDFRDLWANNLLSENYKFSLSEKIIFRITEKYVKKWLKRAEFITTVSNPLADFLSQKINKKVFVFENGFDTENVNMSTETNSDIFEFSVVGTIYPQQNYKIMTAGLKKFIQGKKPEQVRLNFIGTDRSPQMIEILTSLIPKDFLNITARLPREQAISIMKRSHVLFYPGWEGYKGFYSGKIFEYLASGRTILIAPGDNDVIDKLIKETATGFVAKSPEEFASIMEKLYNEWRLTGKIVYNGIPEEINKFSRKKIAEDFAQTIQQIEILKNS